MKSGIKSKQQHRRLNEYQRIARGVGIRNRMSSYRQEQIEALEMVLEHLQSLSEENQRALADLTAEYLVFRKNVDAFLSAHLSDVCTLKCYKNRLSACCSKEGIITFFADVVINAIISSEEEIRLLARARRDQQRI